MRKETRRRGLLFLAAVVLLACILVIYFAFIYPHIGEETAENSRAAASSQTESRASGESGPAESTPADSSSEEPESSIESSLPEESKAEESSDAPVSGPETESSTESQPDDSSEEESVPDDSSRGTVNGGIPVAGEDYVIIDPSEWEWNLILVNKDFRLGENLEMDLEYVDGEAVDARIYEALRQMLEDGEAGSDRDFLVCSGYRTVGLQTELFENFMEKVRANNPGLSEEEIYQITATEVAIPGASEHNTGLAVDICAWDFQMLIREYEETSEAQWLKEHCAEYGFILRYPDGKENVTGIIYEPWHFRYVGVEAATYIMDNNLTLEEYLDKVTMS